MTNNYIVTKEGLADLKKELKFRSTEKREELRKSMDAMKAAGDISENEGLELTIEETHLNEARIAELEKILKNAKIQDNKSGHVSIGSTVDILIKDSKDSKSFKIVGEEEANPIENKISYLSPLGAILLNKKLNDEVKFDKPNGDSIVYVIKKIEI